MNMTRVLNAVILAGLVPVLAACGSGFGGWFGGKRTPAAPMTAEQAEQVRINQQRSAQHFYRIDNELTPQQNRRNTIWDLFGAKNDTDIGGNVNRHLWNAALDTLNFLPVETVDPFSGVISTGYGTPPGGGRAYRATIYISDPALDARSLKVALQTRGGGPVSPAIVSQVEDAILTRARQLRTRDSRL